LVRLSRFPNLTGRTKQAVSRFVAEPNALLDGALSADCLRLSQAFFYGHGTGSKTDRVKLIEAAPIDLRTGRKRPGKSALMRTAPTMPSNVVRLNTASKASTAITAKPDWFRKGLTHSHNALPWSASAATGRLCELFVAYARSVQLLVCSEVAS
jgi:hypothetical protein